MSRKKKNVVNMHITIPYGGSVYGKSRLGALIIDAFGQPEGHGVGFGEENFSYYNVGRKLAERAQRGAKKAFGNKVKIYIDEVI